MASLPPPSPSPSSPSSPPTTDDLYIFGYGSLCWKPSLDFADCPSFTGLITNGIDPLPGNSPLPLTSSTLAPSTISPSSRDTYIRTWSQRSCDHRGTPSSYGIVCNLLKHSELTTYFDTHPAPPPSDSPPDYTLGTLYLLPAATKQSILASLDVREKGGYAREFVQVYKWIDATDATDGASLAPVTALLYRGTSPSDAESLEYRVCDDKFNFYPRVLYDEMYQARRIAAGVGPSGDNWVYLKQLCDWLKMVGEKMPRDTAGDTR